jgi:purine nucleoside permease
MNWSPDGIGAFGKRFITVLVPSPLSLTDLPSHKARGPSGNETLVLRGSMSTYRFILMKSMSFCLAALVAVFSTSAMAVNKPWPVKVVIITTYEVGADTGDKPGELQLWAEREPLTEKIDFPGGIHPLLTNRDHSIVVMVSGIGLINAGASVMALAFDPRFDVKKAYWLLAGIAGVDPKVGAIGDAAWADYVVGDFAKSMDAREAPTDWPYAIYPFQSKLGAGHMPEQSMSYGPFDHYAQVFPLDPGLTKWAYNLTKDVELYSTADISRFEKGWSEFPAATLPPKVFIGASFSSNHFWHGKALNQWARDWVSMFTNGKGRFAMSNTEDAAVTEATARLDRMGAVDGRRLMILRTASNDTVPAIGQTTFESVNSPFPFGGVPGFEAAYRVGSKVVHELANNWPKYADHVPTGDVP